MFLGDNVSLPALAGILLGMLAGITTHEFSHAAVADQLGDHQPRALGRVSLNPLRHLDPLGTALLVLVGIGWGKPVPVNVAALRPGRAGMAFVAGAGPVANVMVALILALAYRAFDLTGTGGTVLQLIYVATVVNLLLAILNLIPIPPLDGFAVLTALVPPRWEYSIRRYQGYGVVLLLLLLILPNSPLRGVLGLAYPWAALLCGL
ncbi:MAG: site-2 protease family protein [Chloroflexota bacterium]